MNSNQDHVFGIQKKFFYDLTVTLFFYYYKSMFSFFHPLNHVIQRVSQVIIVIKTTCTGHIRYCRHELGIIKHLFHKSIGMHLHRKPSLLRNLESHLSWLSAALLLRRGATRRGILSEERGVQFLASHGTLSCRRYGVVHEGVAAFQRANLGWVDVFYFDGLFWFLSERWYSEGWHVVVKERARGLFAFALAWLGRLDGVGLDWKAHGDDLLA